MRGTRTVIGAAALLFGGAACADLEVTNPNDPDRERALAEPGDIEQLISGAFNSWWTGQSTFGGMRLAISTTGFEHSAWPANQGMVAFSALPREAPRNSTAWEFYANLTSTWDQSYEAVASASQGLEAMAELEEGALSQDREMRAQAFARFVQGLGHGTVALLYDQGQVFDETMDLEDLDPPVPYDELMDAALGYLDDAIAIAEANEFTLPDGWMSRSLSNEELVEWAYAYKAHFRTAVARDPEERAAVDWNQVLSDIENSGGTGKELALTPGGTFDFGALGNMNALLWSQFPNQYLGMADQSGNYQDWISEAPGDRMPFTIVTPDERWPQGETLDEQLENPGLYFNAMTSGERSASHQQAGRGTWRWSNYRLTRYFDWLGGESIMHAEVSEDHLRLLEAEAHYRLGSEGQAVELIDETRIENGGLDSAADNDDCVPRLPDGSCGDVFEALKWEWRAETTHNGFGNYYFSARGWGDLPEGTFLHFPVPAEDAELLGEPVNQYGGVGGEDAAPVSPNYGF